jgi:hypothetical protein
LEVRVLRSRAASPEEVDFPGVEQAALLRRHLRQHQPETVALLTSLPPPQLNAAQWLADNRAAWGIENGLHLRLDVSHLDDQCRVRLPKSMRVHGPVAALQQQPVHALAQPPRQAQAQNHNRFFHRHERRTSSLCHPLPPRPPAKLPNSFVNSPCPPLLTNLLCWTANNLSRAAVKAC